jgi:hypothetical protein
MQGRSRRCRRPEPRRWRPLTCTRGIESHVHTGNRIKCQVACKPGSVPARTRAMAIHLGRPLPDASRDRPGRRRGKRACRSKPACRPYLVLLPVGFTMPAPLPGPRCALAAPFHPYRRLAPAVCFLWHFPWGRPRRALPGTVFPWSPDFPPPLWPKPGEGGHPATWHP